MKKLDLGQTINTLANVGVIAGIVFLGLELQQNNLLLRNQARYVLMDNIVTANTRWAENAELMDVRVKAINGEPLSQAEILRLVADSAAVFANWAWEYDQYRLGLMDAIPEAYRGHLSRQPYRVEHWEQNKHTYDPEFVRFMDENVINHASR